MKFIIASMKENEITCGEQIHQSDKLNMDAPFFMERVCEIVGYHKDASVH